MLGLPHLEIIFPALNVCSQFVDMIDISEGNDDTLPWEIGVKENSSAVHTVLHGQ